MSEPPSVDAVMARVRNPVLTITRRHGRVLAAEIERLRGLIVRICEAHEEGGDLAHAIDEAGRHVARDAEPAIEEDE